jgi:hypothetical protein
MNTKQYYRANSKGSNSDETQPSRPPRKRYETVVELLLKKSADIRREN